ncbi:MAG: extracellular solute-binding protein [Lachnospiraceae bacterium]|nr:extracellular solute-binding protein [Lachnospiraceae bacterium]
MRRFTKHIAVIGSVIVFAVALAGCGGGNQVEQTPPQATDATETVQGESEAQDIRADLTLWTYPVGGWGDKETVDALIASFNAVYPNITIAVEYVDYKTGDEEVNAAIEANRAPDLILEGPERLVANWGARGLMVDLSNLFETESSIDIYANVVNACRAPDGAYYEYPLCMTAHCMAINEKLFEEAGALQYLDTDTHTWTTENFFKAVQALYDNGTEQAGAIFCAGQGGDQGTRALINNLYGGHYTTADHTAYTVDEAQNIQALQALLAQDGIYFDETLVGGDEQIAFREGKLAMAFCWNVSAQNDTAAGNEAGKTNDGSTIIPMLFPSTDGTSTQLCGGIWGFGVFDNGDANKIEAAKCFIDFMCNDPEQVKENVRQSGYFSVHANVTGIYAGTEFEETMNTFTTYFMPAMGDYYQVAPGWAEARTEWWNMLQRIKQSGDVEAEVATFTKNISAVTAK